MLQPSEAKGANSRADPAHLSRPASLSWLLETIPWLLDCSIGKSIEVCRTGAAPSMRRDDDQCRDRGPCKHARLRNGDGTYRTIHANRAVWGCTIPFTPRFSVERRVCSAAEHDVQLGRMSVFRHDTVGTDLEKKICLAKTHHTVSQCCEQPCIAYWDVLRVTGHRLAPPAAEKTYPEMSAAAARDRPRLR